jgi:NADPH:quinone reductase-like Zn-dependent oxidoreductase
MSRAEILVSGATGRTGGAAIAELIKMGRRVRAYVRSDDKQAAALRQRGVEIAVGDFTDIDAIRAAMEGIRSAYFLYPIAPGILGAAAYFAQAAKEAGVTAIVNMSQDLGAPGVREPRGSGSLGFRAGLRLVRRTDNASSPHVLRRVAGVPAFREGNLGAEEDRIPLRKRAARANHQRGSGARHRPYSG